LRLACKRRSVHSSEHRINRDLFYAHSQLSQTPKRHVKVVVVWVMGDWSLQDAEYEGVGVKIVPAKDALGSDIVLKIRPPHLSKEVPAFKNGGHLISYIQPAINKELVEKLAAKKLTVIGAASPLPDDFGHASSFDIP
jgi:NAD/NADP transhydrogenase alpha subunit